MEGSGPILSTARGRRSRRVAPVPPETPKSLPQFTQLPIGLQSRILSQGLPTTPLSPADQLAFAAATIEPSKGKIIPSVLERIANVPPSRVLSPNSLLPHTITIDYLGRRQDIESKEFTTAKDIKDYIANLFNNNAKPVEYIHLKNEYTIVTIRYFPNQNSGEISIFPHRQIPVTSMLSIKFERVRGEYDTIMISSVSLRLYSITKAGLDTLKEIFIGLHWLRLVFKQIMIVENLVIETPDNVSFQGVPNIEQERKDALNTALVFLKALESNLKMKQGTTRSTK